LSILGVGTNTYGPNTRYSNAKPEERKDLFNKALKRVKWNDDALPYADKLNSAQLKDYKLAKKNHAGKKLVALTDMKPKNDSDNKKQWGNKAYEKYQEDYAAWQKSQDKSLKELEGFSNKEKLKAFEDYWIRPKDQGGKGGTYSDAYWSRYRSLKKITIE